MHLANKNNYIIILMNLKMKNKTYEEAIAELKEIVEQLQGTSISVDELSEQIKKAAQLIEYCKNKLRKTEEEISDLFQEGQ